LPLGMRLHGSSGRWLKPSRAFTLQVPSDSMPTSEDARFTVAALGPEIASDHVRGPSVHCR
jgi:hypothetical protein